MPNAGEWGFDGYITSDCGAVTDIQYNHKYTNSTTATAVATLGAGMDIGWVMHSEKLLCVLAVLL
jgi:beta-glucosidase-like glycosyl hydrolase